MPTSIERSVPRAPQTVAFATAVENSGSICMANSAAFAFITPLGMTTTTITWYASHRDDGPYYPVILSSGTAASTAAVAGKVYITPPELFSCAFVRGVAGTATTAVIMMKT